MYVLLKLAYILVVTCMAKNQRNLLAAGRGSVGGVIIKLVSVIHPVMNGSQLYHDQLHDILNHASREPQLSSIMYV